MKLKRYCLILSLAIFIGIVPQEVMYAEETAVFSVYISTDGQDTNDGTLANPLKSFNAAREKIRRLRDAGTDGLVNVYVRGGDYYLDRSFILNEFDSNVKYIAYQGEDVALKGSTLLTNSNFRKITDNEVLSHFPDYEVANKVLQYNLNAHSIKQKPMNYRGNYNPSWIIKTSTPQELVINNEKQTVARYPNIGYADVLSVLDVGVSGTDAESSTGFTFKADNSRIRHWDKSSGAMIYGHFANGWADRTVTVSSVNSLKNSVTTNEPYTQATAGGKYYIFNLLEELDTAGEYYIDSDTGILYIYPSESFNIDKIELATLEYPILKITNAENITFSGIDFMNGNSYGVLIRNCENVRIEDGTIKNLGNNAVSIYNSYNCGVDGLIIENVYGGVSIQNCGEFETLTPGNCYCRNTLIRNYSNVTYQSAISLSGVGNEASHNEISDSDHLAISFAGNEHKIEYNDIHDVLRCTTDSGVIYAGQTWTSRGNIVRYNYIHDITNAMKIGSPCMALYFDDGFCSADVYGNIIEDFPGIGIYVSGRDFNVYNNIIVNSSHNAIYARQRYADGTNYTTLSGYKELIASPYRSELWKERYEELYTILDENPLCPSGNSIYNNISVGKGTFNFEDVVVNTGIKTTPNLVADAIEMDENYQISKDSEVFTTLSEFKNIEFNKIGIIKEES